MKNNSLTLFIEINNSDFIFTVGENDENGDAKWVNNTRITQDDGIMFGNTSISKPQLIKGDQSTSQGVRYKYGRNLRFEGKNTFKIDRPLDYNLPMFDVNTEYIIAKDNTFFVYNNDYHKFVSMYKNTFQHGGISMDEMIVPLISLNKK